MAERTVRPPRSKLTDTDVRHLLADGLLRSCHQFGPEKVAAEAGCNEKTIRRARDEESTLGLAATFNLLDIDPHALDALAAAKGAMILPMIDKPGGDFIGLAASAISRVSLARLKESAGGEEETDGELIDAEAENDALLAACLERRARIARAKHRRATDTHWTPSTVGE